ncbi:MAG: histidine phosphatase family protein [Propionibacteriaceae bacterium]|nr:histidine phosphatase family protein [Propionibacteriaceae bacterium]
MKTLIVLRHAKSSWETASPDFQRPLAERGVQDAKAAGAILAEYRIDLLLSSSAKRARQTWECAQLGGATAAQAEFSDGIYHAWADELITELNIVDEAVSTVALIGHQPTLGDLITTLAAPGELVAAVANHYPTAGLAVLTFDGAWRDLGPSKAALVRFEIPRG